MGTKMKAEAVAKKQADSKNLEEDAEQKQDIDFMKKRQSEDKGKKDVSPQPGGRAQPQSKDSQIKEKPEKVAPKAKPLKAEVKVEAVFSGASQQTGDNTCCIVEEVRDFDQLAICGIRIHAKKPRTERIGVGVSFSKEMQMLDVELEESFTAKKQEEQAEQALLVADHEEGQLLIQISKYQEDGQLKKAAKRRKSKRVSRDAGQMDRLKPSMGLAFSRDKSPMGTHYLNVDVDIEAGEETSSTDGIIELESLEYEESESSVILELEEDFMDVDVDVSISETKDEEAIEAILLSRPSMM
uniref:Uncharacterized protein n=1 Tax=Ditylenchus dipsaci TaxID=166011 RepID=A0A915ERG3_9BILA